MRLVSLAAALALLFPITANKGNAAPLKSKAEGAGALSSKAAPAPAFEPIPDWVALESLPALDDTKAKAPIVFLLSQSDERVKAEGLENFVRYVIQANSEAGLRGIGTLLIPWSSDHTKLTLHSVSILRGDEKIDALRKSDITVLRRELQLEASTINGSHSLTMPVHGLRAGDRLDVAFSYATKPERIGKVEEIQKMTAPIDVVKVTRRIFIDDDLDVAWKVDPYLAKFERPTARGAKERIFVAANVEPLKEWKFVPGRFKVPLIQLSTYRGWNEVAQIFETNFRAASALPQSSEVARLATEIKGRHASDHARILAVLRVVQDEVRYNATLLGAGGYVPDEAEVVWGRRFGDCKGKTALILALLGKLGIEAEPVLASANYDDALPTALPSLAMLDHVYVRAKSGSDVLYLDGTLQGQRTIDELRRPPTRALIPVYAEKSLIKPEIARPVAPLVESRLDWDMRQSLADDVPFVATLILRGEKAAAMRARLADELDQEKIINSAKDSVMRIENDDLQFVEQRAENEDGSYIFVFNGKVDPDWRPVEGLKGNRFDLGKGAAHWEPDFDRSDPKSVAFPVALEFPLWERNVETVRLPDDGAEFWIDAEPLSMDVARTTLKRTVTKDGPIVTSTSDFIRTGDEISADVAIEAEKTLEVTGDKVDYVVAKKRLRLPE